MKNKQNRLYSIFRLINDKTGNNKEKKKKRYVYRSYFSSADSIPNSYDV